MRAVPHMICSLVALVAAAGGAAAETFEDKARDARRVRDLEDVVWPLTAACDQGDDVQQRQCRQVRDQAARGLTGATLLVDAEPGALDLGAWNAAKKSVSVTVTACISCAGVAIDGRRWHVTGKPPRLEGGKVRTSALHDRARQFPDGAAAQAWLDSMAGARVELVVRVPDKRRWHAGGKDGLLLEVLAHRVIRPCTGEIVIATPASGNVPPDKQACTGDEGELVAALTPELVREAMKPVVEAARACFAQHQLAGKTRLDLTIAGDGSLTEYERAGDFAMTPTGRCIDDAVRTVRFPRSLRPSTKIGYPLALP